MENVIRLPSVIISAKEVMFFASVCLFVGLSVSCKDYSKSYGYVFMNFVETVGLGTRNNQLDI